MISAGKAKRNKRLGCYVISHFSHAQLFATVWTIAHQASLSLESSRQEYWSGCHFLLQESSQRLIPCLLYLLHWQEGS